MSEFMKQIEKELKEDPRLAQLSRQEELILDVTELILEKMEQKGISKSKLAEMLNTNKSHITQLLRGSRNMTLRTVSDIFFKLDSIVVVDAITESEYENKYSVPESIFGYVTDWKPVKHLNAFQYSESTSEPMAA